VIWATHQPVKGRPLDWTLNAPVGAATTPSCDERRSRANDSRRHCTTTTSSTAAWTLADAIHAAANRGLLVHIRLGPYVCAEYTYGGIPEWVAIEYPDIVMRRANPQWMAVMAEFVTNATAYLKDEQLFSYQGGPIVLAQIENELGEDDVALNEDVSKVSSKIGTPTVQDYADWCGELAQDLVPDVVWTMCFGLSANNTIATYNGFFDDVYWLDMHGDSGRIQVDQPAMWTEAEGTI
jgi:Glycosyl hydrolases family 35